MFKLIHLAAVAGLAIALPATAGDGAPADDGASKPKEKMVCQRITEVGSRSSKKVCQTEAQWRAQREQAQRDLADSKRDD